MTTLSTKMVTYFSPIRFVSELTHHSPAYRTGSEDSIGSLLLPPTPPFSPLELTPTTSPNASPILLRHRFSSVGSPTPVVKLIVESLTSKVRRHLIGQFDEGAFDWSVW